SVGDTLPQPARHLLGTAFDIALAFVAIGDDDAKDFEHRVGIIRIPAAGTEADLAEHLAVMEGTFGEGRRGCHEIVEAAVVPDRYEPIPDCLDGRNVARLDRLRDRGEACRLFKRLAPRLG